MSDDQIPEDENTSTAQTPVAGGVVNPQDHEKDGEMTEAQAAELRELTEKHGEEFDANLDAQQAQERIDELKSR